jgi:hypothetical protein
MVHRGDSCRENVQTYVFLLIRREYEAEILRDLRKMRKEEATVHEQVKESILKHHHR